MAFDPFLYVALGLGVLAGRLLPRRHRGWVPSATLATVAVLVGLLGASLVPLGGTTLLETVPVALGFSALILGATAAVYLLLVRRRAPELPPRPLPAHAGRVPVSVGLLGALGVGYALGRAVPFDAGAALPYALYALLALVGFDLRLVRRGLLRVWVPLAAAGSAATGAALLFAFVSGTSPSVSLATSLAFGWYSLAGPLVAARAGAALGLLAFLTNFFREDLTMLLSPALGRRLGGPGLVALGGATAMDTTLFFVTRYGDPESGSLALMSGLVLTLCASLLLPALLALPL